MLLEHERDYGLGMDAMVNICSWNGARNRLWFGHGCKGNRMLLEHERDYGLGMDAKGTGDYGLGMDVNGTVCSWNTNDIMVWAWM